MNVTRVRREHLAGLLATVLLFGLGCGDDGGEPYEMQVDTFNVALAGAFIPYEAERRQPIIDALAASGFHVAMLDVYRGTNITEQGGFGSESGTAFLKPATANCAAMHEPLFSYLAGKGATEYGAVGFCWGAYGVCKLSSLGKLKAGVSCHPSLKVGQMFLGESEEDQVKTVKCPQMFLPAANDPDHYKDGTLKALVEATGNACVTHEFKEMKHGWVPRGDASDP